MGYSPHHHHPFSAGRGSGLLFVHAAESPGHRHRQLHRQFDRRGDDESDAAGADDGHRARPARGGAGWRDAAALAGPGADRRQDLPAVARRADPQRTQHDRPALDGAGARQGALSDRHRRRRASRLDPVRRRGGAAGKPLIPSAPRRDRGRAARITDS